MRTTTVVCAVLASVALARGAASEPIKLTAAQLDTVTAGFAASDVTANSLAVGDNTFAETSVTASATSTGAIEQTSGSGEAYAAGETLAYSSTSSSSDTDQAGVTTSSSATGVGDASAYSYSNSLALNTPGADLAVGVSLSGSSGTIHEAEAESDLVGDTQVDPSVAVNPDAAPHSTAVSVGVAVSLPE